jgi:hypothetical protein
LPREQAGPAARGTRSEESHMRVLFVLVLAVAVVSVGLLVEMERRDEPALGLSALGLLTADGILGAAYGAFAAA